MNKRELAFELYKSSDGTKPLNEIAEEIGSPEGTVRGWKSRYKWDELIGKSAPDLKRSVTTKKRSATCNVANAVKGQEVSKKAKEILDESELETWEELFCIEYLSSFNKTKAYQKAKPKISYESARQLGYRKFTEVHIQKRLSELRQAKVEQHFLSSADIDEKWIAQAFSDLGEFLEFGTNKAGESFIKLKDSAEIDTSLISEIKQGANGEVSIKLVDKQKALMEISKRIKTDTSLDKELLQARINHIKAQTTKALINKDGDENDGGTVINIIDDI